VDSFLDVVEARLKALVMENLSLTEKVQRLTSQLEALEGREKAVQDALVTAQKLREEVQTQSRRDADSLKEQAIRQAEALRDQVQRESESLRGEAHREASILRDEAIREAASVRDHARREGDLLRKEILAEVEAQVLEAEGLLKERQRALEELERSRRKFLKGFRTLLERELDAVEVEESRRPLEDNPVELDLRGWMRARFAEAAEAAETEEKPEEPSAGGPVSWIQASPAPGYEPVIDLDQAAALGKEGDEAGEGWGGVPGDEPPEGEFSDIVPVGDFEPPPDGGTHNGLELGEGELGEGGTERDWEAEVQALDSELGPPDSGPGPSDGSEDVEGAGGVGEVGGDQTPHREAEGGADRLEDASGPRGVDASFGSTVDEILGGRSGRREAPPSEPLWLSSLLEQEEAGERGFGGRDPEATDSDEGTIGGDTEDGETPGPVDEEDDEEEPGIG
jgi:cell division septum initiation protein DivIVA